MKNKRKRGAADSSAVPTIEALIEQCNVLQETIEMHLKEQKEELQECEGARVKTDALNV